MIQKFHQQLNGGEIGIFQTCQQVNSDNKSPVGQSEGHSDVKNISDESMKYSRSEAGNGVRIEESDGEMKEEGNHSPVILHPRHPMSVLRACHVCDQVSDIFSAILRKLRSLSDEGNSFQDLTTYLGEVEQNFQGPCHLGRVKLVFEKRSLENLRNITLPCIVRFFAWCNIRLHESIFPKQLVTPRKCCQFLKDEIKIFNHSLPLLDELLRSLELLQYVQKEIFEDVDIVSPDWSSCFKLEKVQCENIKGLLQASILPTVKSENDDTKFLDSNFQDDPEGPYQQRIPYDIVLPYSSSQISQTASMSIAFVKSMQTNIQELTAENKKLQEQNTYLRKILGSFAELQSQSNQIPSGTQSFVPEDNSPYQKHEFEQANMRPQRGNDYRSVCQDSLPVDATISHNSVQGNPEVNTHRPTLSAGNINDKIVSPNIYFPANRNQPTWHRHNSELGTHVPHHQSNIDFVEDNFHDRARWSSTEIERTSETNSPIDNNELDSEDMNPELMISSRGERFQHPMTSDGKNYATYPDGTLKITMANEMESVYSIYNEYLQSLQPQILSYAKDFGRSRLAHFRKKRTFQKRKAFFQLVHKISTELDAEAEEILDFIDAIRVEENRSVVWVCNNLKKLKEEMARKRPELTRLLIDNS